MHFCTFVIIGKGDPETLVAKALQPFDEALEVPPYRRYLDGFEIGLMAQRYHLKQSDLHALAEHMEEWTGREGGVDRRGLYHMSTCNPEGRFDWFEIGGRWDGYIKGSKRNAISARALSVSPRLKDCLPYYIVAPEGKWLEHERFFPEGSKGHFERKPDDKWLGEVRSALERHTDLRVVCVDIHV